MIVPRTKLFLANGREIYVYGNPFRPREGITSEEILRAEPAGHYDSDRNEVVMTEPTSMFEGRIAPGG